MSETQLEVSNLHVMTRQGKVRGKYMTSFGGKDFLAFQGIPYAQPPVGILRYKPPQEPIAWQGTRDCTKEGSMCVQIDSLTNKLTGSEDCLYLNVYTSCIDADESSRGLPVMVWIYGGGFYGGSGGTELYGPEFLLDEDIVLVTLNYRSGAFGFLSLGTKEVSGNYGLKDQVAALRWVRNNIAKFGGDPLNVTIFGESAGGASVNFHMFSPMSRGLFQRVIAQSGSAINNWAIERSPLAKATDMARRLGCLENASEEQILKCFSEVNAQELVKADLQIEFRRGTYFVPVLEPEGTEGAFLTEDPRVMLDRGDIADVPIIAGFTSDEGLMQLGVLKVVGGSATERLEHMWSRMLPPRLGVVEDSPEAREIGQAFKEFYERRVPGDDEDRYVVTCSDRIFTLEIDELVRKIAALRRNPVFYYLFSYVGTLGVFTNLGLANKKGAGHAEELGYLFTRDSHKEKLKNINETDLKIIKYIVKLWTNFAKTGNPTPEDSLELEWQPVMAPLHDYNMVSTRYLDIGDKIIMHQDDMLGETVAFWNQILLRFRHYFKM